MRVYLILTLLIIFTIPILNIAFLYILKSVYRPKIMFIIHFSTFLIPLVLFKFNREFAFKFFFCDIASLLLLYISNKLYCNLIKNVLAGIVYQIFESPVISEIYQVKSRIYSRTLEGYILIDLQDETYKVFPNIDSFSTNDKVVFKKLGLAKDI